MNTTLAIASILWVVGCLTGGFGWLVATGSVPTRQVLTSDVAAEGLRSLFTGLGSKILRAGGAGASLAGFFVAAIHTPFSAGTGAIVPGFVQAAVDNPHSAWLWLPGVGAVAGSYVLSNVSERLIARWTFRLAYPSPMKMDAEEQAILTISPHEANRGGQLKASVQIVGSNFSIEPDRQEVQLGSQATLCEIKLTPRRIGQQPLEVEFKDEDGESIGRRATSIRVVQYRFGKFVVPNRVARLTALLTAVFLFGGALLTYVDVGPKVLSHLGGSTTP